MKIIFGNIKGMERGEKRQRGLWVWNLCMDVLLLLSVYIFLF